MLPEYQETKDGFEMQWGTNHVGHFHLTNLLLPALKNGTDARVVCVSSIAHCLRMPEDFGAAPIGKYYPPKEEDYDPRINYSLSKISNMLHATALDQKYSDEGVNAYSLHPGWVYDTNLTRSMGGSML